MNIVKKNIFDIDFNFYYREESLGDKGVIGQVIDGKCFDIERWHQGRVGRAYYNHIIKNQKKPLIIDAGANIGASSIFFAAAYKGSKIVAIEPERKNVEILKLNLNQLTDCEIIDGALGSKEGTLYLQDPGLSDWGFRVGDPLSAISGQKNALKGEYAVKVETMQNILDDNLSYIPFIAKIDIEGGEAGLFEYDNNWFNRFAIIIFETHDWMLPFSGVSNGLIKAAAQGKFDVTYHGENLFFFNHKYLFEHHNPF